MSDPGEVVQDNTWLGWSSATDGQLTVVGSPRVDRTDFENAGLAFVYDNGSGDLVATLESPDPVEDQNFGWTVGISGDHAVVGTRTNSVERAYVFDAATGILRHTLSPSDPDLGFDDTSSVGFGEAVAISGDRVLIGAPGVDETFDDSGAAYVFSAATGNLIRQISNPDPDENDAFGSSLAVDDGTVVVAARSDASDDENGGSVYVFDAGTGDLIKPLPNPTPAATDQFGAAVAIDSRTVVVGAPGASSVFVFDIDSADPPRKLARTAVAEADKFGIAVGIDAQTVIVGAHLSDSGASDAGIAELFDATTGSFVASILNPTPKTAEHFGRSVAIAGGNAVVTAWRDGTGAIGAGSAYIYDTTTNVLAHTLANPTLATRNQFGSSQAVAASDEYLLVGAPADDAGAADAGQAYLYSSQDDTLIHRFAATTPKTRNEFGFSVAVNSEFAVIGAPGIDEIGVSDAGRIFVFETQSGTQLLELPNPSPEPSDQFGRSLAVSGNVVAVGVPFDDIVVGESRFRNAGSVYLFNVTTGDMIAHVLNPSPGQNDEFGFSVALQDNTLVIGSRSDDDDTEDGGAAFVVDLADTESTTKLANPTPSANDEFGQTVAISGGRIFVGAPNDKPTAGVQGSVQVYDLSNSNWLRSIDNPESPRNLFGSAISAADGRLIVGAYEQDAGGPNTGSAYLFDVESGERLNVFRKAEAKDFDRFGSAVAITDSVIAIGVPSEDGLTIDRGAVYLFRDNDLPADVNLAPVAVDDSIATDETLMVTTDVITNDSDPNASNLLTLAPGSVEILSARTADGLDVTLRTATVRQNVREVIFDPATDFRFLSAGQVATVEIQYTVADDGEPSLTDSGSLIVQVTGVDEGLRGDFDLNGILEANDIDLLFAAMRADDDDPFFDLTADGNVDNNDRDEMVLNVMGTNYGDSNLDGLFNSSDLLVVFQAGQFEDDQPLSSTWATGDWNGDGEFDTSDLVIAFQTGAYTTE